MKSGQIDGYLHDVAFFVQPSADIATHMIQHVEIQRAYCLAAFQHGNELPRGNDTPVPEPSAKRLGACHVVIVQLGLGLIEHLEFLVGDCVREYSFYCLDMLLLFHYIIVKE